MEEILNEEIGMSSIAPIANFLSCNQVDLKQSTTCPINLIRRMTKDSPSSSRRSL